MLTWYILSVAVHTPTNLAQVLKKVAAGRLKAGRAHWSSCDVLNHLDLLHWHKTVKLLRCMARKIVAPPITMSSTGPLRTSGPQPHATLLSFFLPPYLSRGKSLPHWFAGNNEQRSFIKSNLTELVKIQEDHTGEISRKDEQKSF